MFHRGRSFLASSPCQVMSLVLGCFQETLSLLLFFLMAQDRRSQKILSGCPQHVEPQWTRLRSWRSGRFEKMSRIFMCVVTVFCLCSHICNYLFFCENKASMTNASRQSRSLAQVCTFVVTPSRATDSCGRRESCLEGESGGEEWVSGS